MIMPTHSSVTFSPKNQWQLELNFILLVQCFRYISLSSGSLHLNSLHSRIPYLTHESVKFGHLVPIHIHKPQSESKPFSLRVEFFEIWNCVI